VKILAFDTATEQCSAALWIDGTWIERDEPRPHGANERLLGMIGELLAEGGLSLRSLDAVAFGRGPGGFTGVRIAVAVAQGLGFAAGLPLVPISDLRALAQRAFSQRDAPPRALICQDARMGQVYWGCFERSGGARTVTPEAVADPTRVRLPAAWADEAVCAAGSGLAAYPALRALSGPAPGAVYEQLRPRALEIAALAALDGLEHAVAPEQAQPMYLRDEVAAPPLRN
jgi:tRNA threonylcarbamoyladenosine biosynthesis protein TsaB